MKSFKNLFIVLTMLFIVASCSSDNDNEPKIDVANYSIANISNEVVNNIITTSFDITYKGENIVCDTCGVYIIDSAEYDAHIASDPTNCALWEEYAKNEKLAKVDKAKFNLEANFETEYYVLPYIAFANSNEKVCGQVAKVAIGKDNRVEKTTFKVNNVEFTMVKVEGGSFVMGNNEGDTREKPEHKVTITKDYYIAETLVTQELWVAVMGSNPSTVTTGVNYPVDYLSWDDCQSFITALNAKTGKTFRLPTEAEWEYAAKGGNRTNNFKFAGSNTIEDVAWFYNNSDDTTHPVKSKKPNELEIYDMSGSLWEWCNDWFDFYNDADATDPKGPESGMMCVMRGGSSYDISKYCGVTFRSNNPPFLAHRSQGMRLALTAE